MTRSRDISPEDRKRIIGPSREARPMEPKQWHMVYGSYCNCDNGRHGPRHQLTLASLTELEQERARLRLALEEIAKGGCGHCPHNEWEHRSWDNGEIPELGGCTEAGCECTSYHDGSDIARTALAHEPVKEEAEYDCGGPSKCSRAVCLATGECSDPQRHWKSRPHGSAE